MILEGAVYAVVTDWWNAWGGAVMWAAGAVGACMISLYKFQRQLDKQFTMLDRRLYRIEIELGIRRQLRIQPSRPDEDEHG